MTKKPTYEELEKKIQELTENQDKYELVTETIAHGFQEIDTTGKILFANSAFHKMCGYKNGDLIGKSMYDLFPEDADLKVLRDYIKTLIQKQPEPESWFGKMIKKNGNLFDVQTDWNYKLNRHGDVIGFISILSDITERKLAEKRLQLQALVLDQIKDHVTITDLSGVIIYVNNVQERTIGYSKDESIGRTTEIWGDDPEQGATQKEIVRDTFRNGSWRGEVVNYTKDGCEIIMDCRTQIIKDNEGNPISMCGIATDITERKRIEKVLRESERKYRLLAESMDDVIIQLSPAGKLLYVSPNVKEFGGYAPKNEIGNDMSKYFENDTDIIRAVESLKKVLETHESGVFEFLFKPKNTNPFPVELTYYPIITNNKVTITQLVLRDITERKQAEQKLKHSKLQLEAVLNNIDAIIYIADMESYEILFMNNHMKKLFGKDLIGQTCWQSLHENNSGPCDFCTNDKLIDTNGNSKEPYVWEIYNQILKKWYQLHDQAIPWADGRLVRMEIAVDITDLKQSEEEREKLINELQEALKNIKTLSGLLPICAHCKKIRDDKGYWNNLEGYIQTHSEAEFSHGMCPECSDELYGKEDWYIKMKKKKSQEE